MRSVVCGVVGIGIFGARGVVLCDQLVVAAVLEGALFFGEVGDADNVSFVVVFVRLTEILTVELGCVKVNRIDVLVIGEVIRQAEEETSKRGRKSFWKPLFRAPRIVFKKMPSKVRFVFKQNPFKI